MTRWIKIDRICLLRFLLIFVCFSLTSCGYLTWLYHLTNVPSAPAPASIDLYSMVIGYLCQAGGIGIFSVVIHRRPKMLNYTTFMISCILYIIFLIPSMLAVHIRSILACGFISNLFCGIIAGFYIHNLAGESVTERRGRIFGFAYGLSTIIVWLTTLKWNYLYSNYAIFLYTFMAIAAAVIYVALPELKGTVPGGGEEEPAEDDRDDRSETSCVQIVLLASVTVILLSLVKNLGFAFPTSDILSGTSLEFSRIFYGTGLVLAGLVNDKSRRIGSVLCLSSLVFPFVMLVLSGKLIPSLILWCLNYFFFGFFSVFRVILFSDISVEKRMLWVSGFGLLFGRIGDAAGTFICSGLNDKTELLVIAAAALFILTVFLFFQLYHKLYVRSSSGEEKTVVIGEKERFEQFSIRFGLSRREKDVLRCILREQSNPEIADSLFIAESTVKFHIHNLLKKTDCRNREELMARFFSEKYEKP